MAEHDNFGSQLFELRYCCGGSQGTVVQGTGRHRRQLLSVQEINPPVQTEQTVERVAAANTLLPLKTEALLVALA